MRRMGLIVVLGATLGAAGACSNTEFKSTWQDPSAQKMQLKGRRVAAFVVTPNEALRRAGESALANELSKRGVLAIPGYDIIEGGDMKSREALRSRLETAGIEGSVVMRVIDRRQEVSYVPGMDPHGASFYGYWGYGWSAVSDPAYLATDTIVSVETLVYSVSDDKLLWAGVSETMDPGTIDSSVKAIVDKAAKAMKKSGLIPK